MENITVKINGVELEVPKGTTVLEAAHQAGFEIPTLCYMKELAPDGSCRMCLVEVEGARGLMTACAAPVTEGMVVRTNTPEVLESRKFILQMMLSNHTGDCMSCAANGKCKLQPAPSSAIGKDFPGIILRAGSRQFPFQDQSNKCRLPGSVLTKQYRS